MKSGKLGVAVVATLWAFCSAVHAQTDVNLAHGLEPYKPYMGRNLDSVSLTNGNLMLQIPLVSYLQRRGTNTFCLPQNIGCFHTCLGLILKKSIASLCRISGFITPL